MPSITAPGAEGLDSRRAAFARAEEAGRCALRHTVTCAVNDLSGQGRWVLELGCGHGHFLAEYARRRPEVRCLGVDYCQDRIRRAERKQARGALGNLRFIRGEVRQFVAALPEDLCFDEVFVLFPDPWPKRRHHKHRFVGPELLAALRRSTTIGTKFYFRSDSPDYVAEVRRLFALEAAWQVTGEDRLPVETQTVFQDKANGYGTVVARRVS